MKQPTIFTTQFIALCLSSYLFFCSFNLIIPELPSMLDEMGGKDYQGLLIALFTLTAGSSRPISGLFTDYWGRKPVMIWGVFICVICGILYPIANSIFALLLLRFVHGMSTGFKPTGTSALVSDLSPVNRRGEAMGILGACGSLGMASGPALGSLIAIHYSTTLMFNISSVLALLSILVILGIQETLPKERRLGPIKSFSQFNRKNLFEPKVLPAAIVMVLATFSFGVHLTITPDFSSALGLENKGLFFVFLTGSSIFVRLFAGKASDKHGRVPVLLIGMAFLMIGLLVMYFTNTPFLMFAAGIALGISTGICSPTILAWSVDLGDKEKAGVALSTTFIALEIGIGLGSLLSGTFFNQSINDFQNAYLISFILATIGFIYLFFIPNKKLSFAENEVV